MGRQDYYLEAFNGKLAGKADDVFKIVWFALLPELNLSKNNFEEFLSLINTKTDNFPIYLEMPKDYSRNTFVFKRGNWLVHGDSVQADVPAFMNKFKHKGDSKN